jgi:hypothetical protein
MEDFPMTNTLNLSTERPSTHRPWEDWISMGVGLLIVISPWLAQELGSQFVVLNAVVIGLLVISLAGMELVVLRASEEWLELACGLWLMISPWLFGYSQAPALMTMHIVFGAFVAVLAILELRQDWGRVAT